MVIRQEDQDQDDGRSAQHVPPDRALLKIDSKVTRRMLTMAAMTRTPMK